MNKFLLRALPSLLFLASLTSIPVRTAEAQPAPGRCADNPAACTEAVDRIQQRCAEDPAACERTRSRLKDLKARCDADPAACEDKKEKFREKRDELKARCDADPAACEQKKQEIRDRVEEHRRNEVLPAGQTPPTIPPRPQQ